MCTGVNEKGLLASTNHILLQQRPQIGFHLILVLPAHAQ